MAFALVLPLAPRAQETAPTPADFMRKAIEGDNSEIRLGALAQERAASPGVRDFGKMLQQDHAKARLEADKVAQGLGQKAPTGMSSEAEAEFHKLQGLNGAAFDKEFVSYMVDDHQKDIADFTAEAAQTGPAATMAQRQLPTLQKHLQTAQSLAGPPAATP